MKYVAIPRGFNRRPGMLDLLPEFKRQVEVPDLPGWVVWTNQP